MDKTSNSLNWFEIPVSDLARARHFYQVIFSIHLESMDLGVMEMVMFPGEGDNGKVSGALVKSDWHRPSSDGTMVYLNANPSMDAVLEKIEPMGGHIKMGKTLIAAGMGYMAFFIDSEGNMVGLHSLE